jgi:hypothetical protein
VTGPGIVIDIPSFIKIGSGIKKLRGWGYTVTIEIAKAQFIFFKIRKVG